MTLPELLALPILTHTTITKTITSKYKLKVKSMIPTNSRITLWKTIPWLFTLYDWQNATKNCSCFSWWKEAPIAKKEEFRKSCNNQMNIKQNEEKWASQSRVLNRAGMPPCSRKIIF